MDDVTWTMSLELHDRSLTYPSGIRALHGVTLSVGSGLFGLLGPNGAGKSTHMRTLAMLQQPDSGTIRLHDLDRLKQLALARTRIGYLPRDFGLYPQLTAERTLAYFVQLKGLHDRARRCRVVYQLLDHLPGDTRRLHARWDIRMPSNSNRRKVAAAVAYRRSTVAVTQRNASTPPGCVST